MASNRQVHLSPWRQCLVTAGKWQTVSKQQLWWAALCCTVKERKVHIAVYILDVTALQSAAVTCMKLNVTEEYDKVTKWVARWPRTPGWSIFSCHDALLSKKHLEVHFIVFCHPLLLNNYWWIPKLLELNISTQRRPKRRLSAEHCHGNKRWCIVEIYDPPNSCVIGVKT